MRDPEIFKYDVRVRDRMLRSGRTNSEEIGKLLSGLPDLEAEAEIVSLNQPALDAAANATAAPRQTLPPASSSEDDDSEDDDVEEGDGA